MRIGVARLGLRREAIVQLEFLRSHQLEAEDAETKEDHDETTPPHHVGDSGLFSRKLRKHVVPCQEAFGLDPTVTVQGGELCRFHQHDFLTLLVLLLAQVIKSTNERTLAGLVVLIALRAQVSGLGDRSQFEGLHLLCSLRFKVDEVLPELSFLSLHGLEGGTIPVLPARTLAGSFESYLLGLCGERVGERLPLVGLSGDYFLPLFLPVSPERVDVSRRDSRGSARLGGELHLFLSDAGVKTLALHLEGLVTDLVDGDLLRGGDPFVDLGFEHRELDRDSRQEGDDHEERSASRDGPPCGLTGRRIGHDDRSIEEHRGEAEDETEGHWQEKPAEAIGPGPRPRPGIDQEHEGQEQGEDRLLLTHTRGQQLVGLVGPQSEEVREELPSTVLEGELLEPISTKRVCHDLLTFPALPGRGRRPSTSDEYTRGHARGSEPYLMKEREPVGFEQKCDFRRSML